MGYVIEKETRTQDFVYCINGALYLKVIPVLYNQRYTFHAKVREW